jgi:DNA-binding winged helix-turn-helix (wHTH) protein/TolB-like protein
VAAISSFRLKIGAFVFDPARGVAVGEGGDCSIEPKVAQVLLALAERPGEVLTRDDLIAQVWKTEYGGDESLSRAISQLRKVFGDERGSARYIETIPKRGYRLVAPVERIDGTNGVSHPNLEIEASRPVPLPVETLPASSNRADEGLQSLHPRKPWHRWQAYAAAGALAAFAVIGITASSWREARPTYNPDVVELRPFAVVDGKPEMDVIAVQAHASVKHILASNQVLVVEGGDEKDVSGASREQPTPEFILSGTVEHSESGYAVTLFLENREDGQTLWSNRFAAAAGELEALREQIGANAAYIVACALSQRSAAPIKPSTAAFKVYFETCDPEIYADDLKALASAQHVTSLAPDDAYGQGFAAIVYAEVGAARPNDSQNESWAASARRAADRALELDPQSEFAPIAIAILTSPLEHWQTMDKLGNEVRNTHPMVRGPRIWSLVSTGRLREAGRAVDETVALAPLSGGCRAAQAIVHSFEGNYAATERRFAENERLWPDHKFSRRFHFVARAFYGPRDEALSLLDTTSKSFDWSGSKQACWRSFIEARTSGDQTAGASVRRLCTGNEVGPVYVARMRAALGDTDGAFEVMSDPSLTWTQADLMVLFLPEMAAIRRDRRFIPMLQRTGLLDYWTRSGHWPDFCSDPSLGYDCKEAASRVLAGLRADLATTPN